MIRTFAIGLAFALAATPSLAGVNLMCSGANAVTADLPLAGTEGLSLLGATVTVGTSTWSTDRDIKHAIQLAPHQSVQIDDRIYVDLADANSERTAIRLRLFQLVGYDETVISGTLEIVDYGAYTVTCEIG